MRNSYEKHGKYGFSLIKKQNIDLTNISLIACSDTKANDKEINKKNGVHFFVDDYRFNGIYNNPERTLSKYSQYEFLLTPDFSTYAEMDLWRQIESVGNAVAHKYETVGTIEGVKVLEKLNKGDSLALPEEAHSSNAYILLDHQGKFKTYREYDDKHYLRYEIGYHPEKNIDSSRKPVLHVHEYKPDNFNNRKPRPISEEEYKKYRKYFRGIL